ncbi:MAG: hypothetical protein ACM3ZU_01395 [Bacteroidota bacterium]
MRPAGPQGEQRSNMHVWEFLGAIAACTGVLTGGLIFIGLLGQSVYFLCVITIAGGGTPQGATLERLLMTGMGLLPHVVIIAAATTLGWLVCTHILRYLLDRIGYSGVLGSRVNLHVPIAAFLWLTSLLVLVASDLSFGVASMTRIYMLILGSLLIVCAEYTLDVRDRKANDSIPMLGADLARHLKKWVPTSKWVVFGSLLLAAIAARIAHVYLDVPIYETTVTISSHARASSQKAGSEVGIDSPVTIEGLLLSSNEQYVQVKSENSPEAYLIPSEQVAFIQISGAVPIRQALQGWLAERAELLQKLRDLVEEGKRLLEESDKAIRESEAMTLESQREIMELEARLQELKKASEEREQRAKEASEAFRRLIKHQPSDGGGK